MKHFLMLLLIEFVFTVGHSQNVGIGTTTPQAKLSVGTNSEFRVDENGNLIRINNVPYFFPAAQGAGGHVLVNDGSGNLAWTSPASVFGDGSAGDLRIYSTDPPRYLYLGAYTLPNGYNLNFRNITIEGRLFVAPGTVIKATGNVTISTGALVVVQPVSSSTSSITTPGIAATVADDYFGGEGIYIGQAAQYVKAPMQVGGSGKQDRNLFVSGYVNGGQGGGGLTIYAKGNITINGLIDANGRNGYFTNTTTPVDAVGPGGGGGGMLVLAAQGNIITGSTANIWANGGNGANGRSSITSPGKGGGGGGGGGIVLLISPNTPSVAANSIQVNGGNAGTNAGTSNFLAGGGGGASGGTGGDGGWTKNGSNLSPTAGNAGHIITIIAPNLEQFLIAR